MMQIMLMPGYRIEGTEDEHEAVNDELIDELFDLTDSDARFYKEYFYQKEHINLLRKDAAKPFAISLVYKDDTQEYIGLIRTVDGNRRVFLARAEIPVGFVRRMLRMGPSYKEIVRSMAPDLHTSRTKVCSSQEVSEALLKLEEKQAIKGLKFGVLYAAAGQTKEDEMFSNVNGSEQFDEFLEFLGTRVTLQGWQRFRAGLDVQTNSTGIQSIFTEWHNTEIMFHVSTLLPFNELDKQQVERKRHIGNDIVMILFQDGDINYRPSTISSRYVQVVILIQPHMIDEQRHYRMCVVCKDDVPPFAPTLPDDPMFKKGDEFREFLYTKLLNAERACYKAPAIGAKLANARTVLLRNLNDEYL